MPPGARDARDALFDQRVDILDSCRIRRGSHAAGSMSVDRHAGTDHVGRVAHRLHVRLVAETPAEILVEQR